MFQPTRSRRARPKPRREALTAHFVSTHALAKSATCGRDAAVGVLYVSTHALAKSATGRPDFRAARKGFNPRAREERDWHKTSGVRATQCFNPRAREERDPPCLLMADDGSGCFNPRAREERDRAWRARWCAHRVSTHALAKSATRGTPPLEASHQLQPTRSRRARRVRYAPRRVAHCVSTHALAKSATHQACRDAECYRLFQPTRSRRARPRSTSTDCLSRSFNPRAREERDDASRHQARQALCFNPRAREERDKNVSDDVVRLAEVSTHALAKARPAHVFGGRKPPGMFQPTRSRRARPRQGADFVRSGRGFNPRARDERDVTVVAMGAALMPFQPTRSRRARPISCTTTPVRRRRFNPRAREERDD